MDFLQNAYSRRRKHAPERRFRQELLQDARQGVERSLERSEETFDFACTARDRFAKGNCDTKKEIHSALGSIPILKDEMLSIQALEPFYILENTLNGDESYNGGEVAGSGNKRLGYLPV